jgi:hypothetical protein
MIKNLLLILLSIGAYVLVQLAVSAADSDTGAGYLHLAMIWLSGFISMLVLRWAIAD